MTYPNMQAIIDFVNSHDDGTPQPRANLTDCGRGVEIRSTEIWPGERVVIIKDLVSTMAGARAVLGY